MRVETARRRALLILALDTTTRAGSVAVVRDGSVVACITGDPAVTHGQRLPGDFARALDRAGVRIGEIDLLAVAAGPGSFTGLRVGIASIQGLAFGRGMRVVPVSALEALARDAAEVSAGEARIAAWMDAQRGEVFAALYDGGGRIVVAPPTCQPPAETLVAWRAALGAGPIVFTGNGVIRHRQVIADSLGAQARIVERVPALAPVIARIAGEEPDRAVLPHAIVPIYVRRPDAEIARDRRGHAP